MVLMSMLMLISLVPEESALFVQYGFRGNGLCTTPNIIPTQPCGPLGVQDDENLRF